MPKAIPVGSRAVRKARTAAGKQRLVNEDWVKKTIDIHYTDESGKVLFVHDKVSLFTALKQLGVTIEEFKAMPIYRIQRRRLKWVREL